MLLVGVITWRHSLDPRTIPIIVFVCMCVTFLDGSELMGPTGLLLVLPVVEDMALIVPVGSLSCSPFLWATSATCATLLCPGQFLRTLPS